MDVENVENADCSVVEIRDYSLNKQRSIEKKLSATEKDPLVITTTDGGIRIKMHAGMYELLKQATNQYFAAPERSKTCKTKDIKDKSGNCVETQYKVSGMRFGGYTLNSYHTTSSYLVNGKNVLYYLEKDLTNIVSLVESRLIDGNFTVLDFNRCIRKMLLEYFQPGRAEESLSPIPKIDSTHDEDHASSHLSQTPDTVPQVLNTQAARESPVQHTQPNIEQTTQTSDCVYDILKSLQKDMAEVKSQLTGHISFTNQKFQQLNDDLVSIKRHVTVNHKATDGNIEDLAYRQNELNISVQTTQSQLQRRIQSVLDTLKTMYENSRQEKSNRPTAVRTNTSSGNLREQLPHNDKSASNTQRREVQPSVDPPLQHSAMPTSSSPRKERTLLIGDSILKGVKERGLDGKTDINVCNGAIVTDVHNVIRRTDLQQYRTVVIFVGGNDVSNGKHPEAFREKLTELTRDVQRHNCRVHLCTVSPREDVDVSIFNKVVREVRAETRADLIDTYQAFVYGDGRTVARHFRNDGIHLSLSGSSTLVASINSHVPIIKTRRSDSASVRGSHPRQPLPTRRDSGYNRSFDRDNSRYDSFNDVRTFRSNRVFHGESRDSRIQYQ